jgi:lipid-A-disaccharide synthase
MGLGGDKMEAAGCRLYVNYREMAYMGYVAVLKNLDKIRRNFRKAYAALEAEKPDVLILIDYPSFNLKVADWCRKHLSKTKIAYYIPPKAWAWKKWRVHHIARVSDEVLGIFPFEPDFYRQYGYPCTYVGNPTVDAVRTWRAENREPKTGNREPLIAVLPGSRPSEVSNCLPRMLEAARRVAGTGRRIVVGAAPGLSDDFYKPYLEGETLTRDTYALLSSAEAGIVNSGTATLEAALLSCPEVAVYHLAFPHIMGLLRPIMFRTPWFTLVNIIARRTVIQELLAYLFTVDNVEQELRRLLTDEAYKKNMLASYEHIRNILGDTPAATGAARRIVRLARS